MLEAQLRELRGNVEELQNSNEALRKQQRDLYADLDRRIKVLEAALKGGAVAPAGGGGGMSLPLRGVRRRRGTVGRSGRPAGL